MAEPPGSQLLRISLHFDPAIADSLRRGGRMSADVKGKLFELLIAYLMRTLGPFETRGRVRTLDGEDDLILRDTSPQPSVLGDYILVECKNWERKVGAPEIKKFGHNVRAASCHSGIMAAKNDITGSEEEPTDARYTVRRHYHRDRIVLVVLTAGDLDRLVSRRVSLGDLLVTKYEEIRFAERQRSAPRAASESKER
jgi:Restriction endonuclease